MRFSDRFVLQQVDVNHLVLLDESTGQEIELNYVEAGHLATGIKYFISDGKPPNE